MTAPSSPPCRSGTWTAVEHERFLEAMVLYPNGPWRLIAGHVRTRSVKQVQTHGQKYQDKVRRHHRGLLKATLNPYHLGHRVDKSTQTKFTNGCIFRQPSVKGSRPGSTPTKQARQENTADDTDGRSGCKSQALAPSTVLHKTSPAKATKRPEQVLHDIPVSLTIEPLPFSHQPEHCDDVEAHTLLEAIHVLLS